MSDTATLLISRCPSVIEHVQELVRSACHVALEVCSVRQAGTRALGPDVGLVIAQMGPADEPEIMRLMCALTQAKRPCATVILTEQFSENQTIALLRAGAAGVVAFPGERERLAFLLSSLTRRYKPKENESRVSDLEGYADFENGHARFLDQMRRVAPQDVTLLLSGETGTGKTRLARQIHQMSQRRGEPFMVVDCGSLSAGLVESELFGHARGAFTGADRERQGKLAAAGAGTLLLDEVNSLPAALQSKLLRAVDERAFEPVGSDKTQRVRARLIAATNVPLEREVEVGRFRADLYFRLNVVSFFLPPLRERRSAIAPLATRFLREFAASNRPDVSRISNDALDALERYPWPGNVRELRNVIDRGMALCNGPALEFEDLPDPVQAASDPRRKGAEDLVFSRV